MSTEPDTFGPLRNLQQAPNPPAEDESDLHWLQGNRAAWRALLGQAIRELGIDDPEAGKARWILEREAAVEQLRQVCEDHGDNDWSNDLHLADVIEKHLARHLS